MPPRLRAAAAGSVAALVWGALEPLDRRLFRHDYADVAVLGKAFTRGPEWQPLGFAMNALIGVIFGLAHNELAQRDDRDRRRLALHLALLEHLALFSTGRLVDRHHPARGEPGVETLFSVPAFAQSTVRHALFGLVLGLLGAEDGAARSR